MDHGWTENRLRNRGLLTALGVGCMVLAPTAAFADAQPAAVNLVPHRAVYDLTLADADDKSGITDLKGRMVYDFSGDACDGYSMSFRFVTEFQDSSGALQVTDLQTTSHEAGDGGRYQFLTKTFIDQNLVEQSRGMVEDKDGKKHVSLKVPVEKQLDFDGSVMFPTAHLVHIIKAARAGENLVLADVFDGSENGEKIYGTTTVIGRADDAVIPISGEAPGADVTLPQGVHWPVSIAYFDPEQATGGEQVPAYQMSFLLYENGISRQMTLDYGDFVMKGKLRQLEVFDESGCSKSE